MTLPAQVLFAAAGAIYLILGGAHLLYTFRSRKFEPHDEALKEQLQKVTLRITRETTFWQAWIGFNASHSTGAMFFGFVLIASAWVPVSDGSYLMAVWVAASIHSGYYTWLARTYWFRVPFAGTALASILILAAGIVDHVSPRMP